MFYFDTETKIQKHESLWTNGVLKRTRHTNFEIYTLTDPLDSKNQEYVCNAGARTGWCKCSKPEGSRVGMMAPKTPLNTFEELRQKVINDFEKQREIWRANPDRLVKAY
jgi:hypothetical protein